MKILISLSYYAPHISGLTNSIKNLAELLVQNGYTIEVLTTQHKKKLPFKQTINNVQVQRIPYLFKIYKGFFMPTFCFSVYLSLRQVDQVIINLPQLEGWIVALMAKIMGKKVHCIYACDVTFEKGLFPKFIEYALRVINMISLLLSDTIITLTDDFIVKVPVRRAEIQVIYPVVHKPVVSKIALADLEARLSPKRRYYIGFVGRIAAEKGIEYLLETIPFLKQQFGDNFVILFAGPSQAVGEGAYLETIHTAFRQAKAQVMHIGELKEESLGVFYSMLDVLVIPSINSTEAFGMVQVEAMFCGTPVVVTNLPGVRVPVRETGMGEIAEPKNTEDLAKKIIMVLRDEETYKKRKPIAEQVFSQEGVLAKYKALLEVK